MRRVFRAAVVAVVFLAAQSRDVAQAQGFFQSLFGGSNTQPSYPQEPRRVLQSPYGYRTPPSAPSRVREGSEEASRSQDGTGSYRTLCVRMCDGYYWPISYATRRSGFYHDANVCRSSCGEEARLFFHGSRDRDTKEMVDISGRNYTKLPTAYLYRKKTVDACKCKPEPWTQTELDRHRVYALNEAETERRRLEQVAIAEQIAAEKAAQAAAEKAAQIAAKAEAVASVKRILAGKSAKPSPAPLAAEATAEVAAVAPAAGGGLDNVTYIRKAARPGSAAEPASGTPKGLPPTSDPAVAAVIAMTNALQPAAPFAEAATPEAPKPDAPKPEATVAAEPPSDSVATEPAKSKRQVVEAPTRAERRQANARQAALHQGGSNPGRPRAIQARAPVAKPSGGFGLGAGSKSMRWPGE